MRRSPRAMATPPTTCSRWRLERGELAQPIVPELPDLLAEVVLAARREQARSIGDVLLRRTRLGLLAARELSDARRPGTQQAGGDGTIDHVAPARRVGAVMARELAWSEQRLEHELALRRGGARRGAHMMPRTGAGAPRACRERARVSPARGRSRARVRRSRGRASHHGHRQRLARLLQRRRPPRGRDAQLSLARELLAAGADIVDVGGESATTGRPPVHVDVEIERVVPLVQAIAGELGALVSVDTYKPAVARAGDRCRREDRQRRQRPARPGPRRGVRTDGRRTGGHAHARRSTRTAAGPRPLRRRHRRRAHLPQRAHRPGHVARRGARAADRRSRSRLRKDARSDHRPARRDRAPARARASAADGHLAQGLHRRADPTPAARAPARHAGRARARRAARRAFVSPTRRRRRRRLPGGARGALRSRDAEQGSGARRGNAPYPMGTGEPSAR